MTLGFCFFRISFIAISCIFFWLPCLSKPPRFSWSSSSEIWIAYFWNFLVWNANKLLAASSYWYHCRHVPAFREVLFESYTTNFGFNHELKEHQRIKRRLQECNKCRNVVAFFKPARSKRHLNRPSAMLLAKKMIHCIKTHSCFSMWQEQLLTHTKMLCNASLY